MVKVPRSQAVCGVVSESGGGVGGCGGGGGGGGGVAAVAITITITAMIQRVASGVHGACPWCPE